MSALDLEYIQAYQLGTESVTHWKPAYAFNPAGRLPRLQRLCFWFLDRWLRVERADKITQYRRALIRSVEVRDLILTQWQTLEAIVMRHGKPRLIIGWETFNQLCREGFQLSPHQFHFHINIPAGRENNSWVQFQSVRVRVTVVPWIEGCFLMYDDPQDGITAG